LEEDMAPYHAQNHGFGGSNDKLLMAQAEKFLYPYKPSVVFLQTGSNDNVGGLTLEQIMENKKKMYATFHEHLPDAKFVVMSGLPLPGRPMHWENINKLNQFLEDYCSKLDYLEFINATPFMMKDGNFRPEYYVKDGVHLNADGHEQWTAAMKKKLEEMGIKP
jgi:lysophospholipase L1-like esterase